MRALVCKAYGPPEPDSLVIEERDDPAPREGQLLVDIAAAGINFPDVLVIAGKYQVKVPPQSVSAVALLKVTLMVEPLPRVLVTLITMSAPS